AIRCANPESSHESASAITRPGTATPARGIAMRLASTPIGATVPKANALIGAVTSVVTSAGAASRARRGARAKARPAQTTAPTPATDSHAPTDCKGPWVLHQHAERRERHHAARRDHALAQARDVRQYQHRAGPDGGRREAEQPEIAEQQDGRRAEAGARREVQFAENEGEPGGDEPNVQPGDGEEVRETRSHVALADIGIEYRVGGEHERDQERRSWDDGLLSSRGTG